MRLLSYVISRSIIVLFVCLGLTAYYLLQDLCEAIARTRQNQVLSPDFDIETELKRWRRRYHLICNYIERINSCFGLILLIELIKGFITFFTFAFDLIVDFENGDIYRPENHTLTLVNIFLMGWCYVTVIIAVCNTIRTQVTFANVSHPILTLNKNMSFFVPFLAQVKRVIMELRQLEFSDNKIQFQVNPIP